MAALSFKKFTLPLTKKRELEGAEEKQKEDRQRCVTKELYKFRSQRLDFKCLNNDEKSSKSTKYILPRVLGVNPSNQTGAPSKTYAHETGNFLVTTPYSVIRPF